MKCLDCGVDLTSEWISIQDSIQLCHLCYEKQYGKETKECVYCQGVADFQWLDGGWYVCTGCIKDGETDTEGESK